MQVGYVLAIVTTVAWGLMVIPIRSARAPGHLGIAVSMPAGILALLPLTVILLASGQRVPSLFSRAGILILASGVCQFSLATVCYYEALRSAEVSVIAPFKCIKSILVMAFVVVLGFEAVTPFSVIACVMGVAGAIVITRTPKRPLSSTEPGTGGSRSVGRGITLALLTCLFWALGDLAMRYAVQTVPALIATPLSLCAAAVVTYSWLLLRGELGAVARMPRRDKICFGVHGAVSFGLGYCAFFAAIRTIGLTEAVIITQAWPVISFCVGIRLYREALTVEKLIGMLLLVGSVYLVLAK